MKRQLSSDTIKVILHGTDDSILRAAEAIVDRFGKEQGPDSDGLTIRLRNRRHKKKQSRVGAGVGWQK